MKKLENISKKEIFTVPEGYFNKLPQAIQSRISDRKKSTILFIHVPVLKYALPTFALVISAIIWFSGPSTTDPESMLSEVDTEYLVAYLNDSDYSTDELLDGIDLDENDLNAIEEEVYDLAIPDQNFEDILNDMDLN